MKPKNAGQIIVAALVASALYVALTAWIVQTVSEDGFGHPLSYWHAWLVAILIGSAGGSHRSTRS